jgi:hypothetical protein
MHSRQHTDRSIPAVIMMHSFSMSNIRRRAAIGVAIAALVAPAAAYAQRTDTTRAREPIRPLSTVPPDSLRPPIGPTRAFILSFLVPGSAQSMLGRHKAAATFLFIEAVCIAMIRESAADVHEARRTANDTLIVSYVDASGNPVVTTSPPRFGSQEVHTREAHVEDWAALLVGNHLFAGADAFVSSHLWDVPIHVGMRATPAGGHAFTLSVMLQR